MKTMGPTSRHSDAARNPRLYSALGYPLALRARATTIAPGTPGATYTPVRRGHGHGTATQRRAQRAGVSIPPRRYFFSGSGLVCGLAGVTGTPAAFTGPPGVNGKVANIDFAWFCICSCICTNMFFDCSI